MHIFLSILFNGIILWAISYFLPEVTATGGLQLFFIGGIIL